MKRFLFVAGFLMLALVPASHAVESLEPLWSILPGDRGYVDGAASTERGMAVNPVTGHVLIASRAGGSGRIFVLDGADGTELREMDTLDLSGGIFPLNVIGVAEDGAVYASNLVLDTSSAGFKIYRWADDAADTLPTVAFEGDPAGVDEFGASLSPQRWGDTMAVRGGGGDTQILLGSRGAGLMAVLTTTDGENFETTPLAGSAHPTGSLGVAFGVGDTFYSKTSSQPLRYVGFDLGTGAATLLQEYATLATVSRPIGTEPGESRLGVLETGGGVVERAVLYDVSEVTIPPILSEAEVLPVDNANTNATGAVGFGGGRMVVLGTNNGLHAYRIESDEVVEPPVIETGPLSVEVIEGGGLTLTVVVSGTPPFGFQWKKGGEELPGETGASLEFTSVGTGDAGEYTVVVTNDGGANSVESVAATLTVVPQVNTGVAETKWTVGIGERDYLAEDNAQRGMAVNPVNGNVIVASRTGGERLVVLDGETGATLREMDTSELSGGLYLINMVGVAEDGAVFATNLSLSGGDFNLYRWENDAAETLPDLVYSAPIDGDPGVGRLGDTIAVRGGGATTEVICGARSGNQAVIFRPGENAFIYTAEVVTVSEIVWDGGVPGFALGLAWGEGSRFWVKDPGSGLRRIGFDAATGAGVIEAEFNEVPGSVRPIAVSAELGLLAGISNENPDNLQLWDVSDLADGPVLVHQAFFASDNGNGNGTGAVGIFGDVVVGLGTNNGLVCLRVDEGFGTRDETKLELVDLGLINGGAQVQFTVRGEDGKTYVVQSSEDLETWTDRQVVTLSGVTEQVFAFPANLAARYYRVVE